MAALTVTTLPGTMDYDGSGAVTPNSLASGTTPDTMASSGWEFVRLENTGTSSADVTISSVADALGRTKDCVVTVAASAIKYAGPFSREGWQNSSSVIEILSDTAGVNAEVLRFPASHSA